MSRWICLVLFGSIDSTLNDRPSRIQRGVFDINHMNSPSSVPPTSTHIPFLESELLDLIHGEEASLQQILQIEASWSPYLVKIHEARASRTSKLLLGWATVRLHW